MNPVNSNSGLWEYNKSSLIAKFDPKVQALFSVLSYMDLSEKRKLFATHSTIQKIVVIDIKISHYQTIDRIFKWLMDTLSSYYPQLAQKIEKLVEPNSNTNTITKFSILDHFTQSNFLKFSNEIIQSGHFNPLLTFLKAHLTAICRFDELNLVGELSLNLLIQNWKDEHTSVEEEVLNNATRLANNRSVKVGILAFFLQHLVSRKGTVISQKECSQLTKPFDQLPKLSQLVPFHFSTSNESDQFSKDLDKCLISLPQEAIRFLASQSPFLLWKLYFQMIQANNYGETSINLLKRLIIDLINADYIDLAVEAVRNFQNLKPRTHKEFVWELYSFIVEILIKKNETKKIFDFMGFHYCWQLILQKNSSDEWMNNLIGGLAWLKEYHILVATVLIKLKKLSLLTTLMKKESAFRIANSQPIWDVIQFPKFILLALFKEGLLSEAIVVVKEWLSDIPAQFYDGASRLLYGFIVSHSRSIKVELGETPLQKAYLKIYRILDDPQWLQLSQAQIEKYLTVIPKVSILSEKSMFDIENPAEDWLFTIATMKINENSPLVPIILSKMKEPNRKAMALFLAAQSGKYNIQAISDCHLQELMIIHNEFSTKEFLQAKTKCEALAEKLLKQKLNLNVSGILKLILKMKGFERTKILLVLQKLAQIEFANKRFSKASKLTQIVFHPTIFSFNLNSNYQTLLEAAFVIAAPLRLNFPQITQAQQLYQHAMQDVNIKLLADISQRRKIAELEIKIELWNEAHESYLWLFANSKELFPQDFGNRGEAALHLGKTQETIEYCKKALDMYQKRT